MDKLFKIFIFTLFFLIFKINNEECEKATPFYKNSECTNECTGDEFQNGDCIISNSIIESKYLNKLIIFGSNEILSFYSIEMPNHDIFLLCCGWEQDFHTPMA